MSNLEHLIENGLCLLDKGKSHREWRELMQQDCNWDGNENITLDNLWEICQYVIFTWDSERELVRCEDCRYYHGKNEGCGATGFYPPSGDWFCADGERR